MGWFGGEEERRRKRNLTILEDKRLAFAKGLSRQNLSFERALLAQAGGGFAGVAIARGAIYFLSGPAPGSDDDFQALHMASARFHFAPHIVPGDGMGGILGFGKKGGRGYKLRITLDDGALTEIELLSALTCVLEISPQEKLSLLSLRRRSGDANFVWDFSPVSPHEMDALVERWAEYLSQAGHATPIG